MFPIIAMWFCVINCSGKVNRGQIALLNVKKITVSVALTETCKITLYNTSKYYFCCSSVFGCFISLLLLWLI